MSQATMGVQGVGPADADSGMRRRAIISCALGNFVELYDFLIFGLFAAQIGANFFPASNPTTPLLSAFATYGVGFLMRPVGAIVIGAYGDRRGRKAALVLTVGLMAGAHGADRPHSLLRLDRHRRPDPADPVPAGAGLLDRRRVGRRGGVPGRVRTAGQARPGRQLASVRGRPGAHVRPAHRGAADLAPRQGDHGLLGLAPALHPGLRAGAGRPLRAHAGVGKPRLRAHQEAARRGSQSVQGRAHHPAPAGAAPPLVWRPSARWATTPSTSTCRPTPPSSSGSRQALPSGRAPPPPSCSPS